MPLEDLWVYPEDDPAWLSSVFAGGSGSKSSVTGLSGQRKRGRPRRDRSPQRTKSLSCWMRTGAYQSGGKRYARFYWGKGHQTMGWMQICGGAVTVPVVQERQKEINQLIAAEKPLTLIQATLRQYSKAKSGPKPF